MATTQPVLRCVSHCLQHYRVTCIDVYWMVAKSSASIWRENHVTLSYTTPYHFEMMPDQRIAGEDRIIDRAGARYYGNTQVGGAVVRNGA